MIYRYGLYTETGLISLAETYEQAEEAKRVLREQYGVEAEIREYDCICKN